MDLTNRTSTPPANGTPPRWTTRQIIYATLIVVAISISFFLLFRFSQIVFTLFLAIVFSTAIRPAVNWLNQRGISRALGVILVYLLILAIAIGVIAAVTPLITQQIGALSEAIPSYYGDLRSTLFLSENLLLQRIALNMPEEISFLSTEDDEPTTTPPPPAGEPVPETPVASVNYPSVFGRTFLALVAIFVLGLYWTLERDRTVRSVLLWVSTARRENARELIQEIEDKVGQFVIGQGILCLSVGSMAMVAYLIIGVPYALVLGIIAGITEAIPIFGPALGALPAIILTVAAAPDKAIWVVVTAAIIQMAENYLLVPRVMNRSVGVNSLVLLLAFVAFSLLFGLPGAIVSVPLAAILQLLVDRFLLAPNLNEAQQTELGRDQISLYRMEAQTLAKDIRKQLVADNEGKQIEDEETIDALEAVTTELDAILARFGQKESTA